MNTIRVTVSSIDEQGRGNRRVELVPADGSLLPAFDAGAHIDVRMPGGLVRQYSLANPPSQRHRYEICVRRDAQSRGGSAYLHDVLTPGQHVEISAPRNCFALEDAAHYVLIAGGIGITPLLSMAQCLAERGASFELHYYGRSEADAPYVQQLRAGFGGVGGATVALHFSETGDSLRNALPASLRTPSAQTLVYVCGPAAMMDHLRAETSRIGWQDSQIRSEAFHAEPVTALSGDGTFEVELASTGRVFVVPVGKTIAGVLLDNAVDVSLSCEQGICGACLTGIKSGRADHRDEVLSDEEKQANTLIAVCCSRAQSARIVLDL
ncbi:PDR/VanB family oxidoreductase [Paraburkholderia sp.]|uniref:PDR/VanB family oxidoreductase n=1 Tax=Paraburkholderia sp. TaxID=1926495 RepID=UPI002394EF40|nr:PDR/VanB family oxidoreductase [Paraburkholderia sp.]MDE1184734.1 PDR/VanB family oxidoreductase [Paraburkholderia sp.]